ncbi:hypothetical protein ACI3LZ_000047 [Candidozyma auris]
MWTYLWPFFEGLTLRKIPQAVNKYVPEEFKLLLKSSQSSIACITNKINVPKLFCMDLIQISTGNNIFAFLEVVSSIGSTFVELSHHYPKEKETPNQLYQDPGNSLFTGAP